MRRVANATKPVPRNKSRNLDIAKRNFSGELTVTVPVNEEWGGCLVRPTGLSNFIDVRTKSIIGMMAESDIMKKLGACFDDVKVVDAHMCIDLSRTPVLKLVGANTPRHYIFSIYHELLSDEHPFFTTQPVSNIITLPEMGETVPGFEDYVACDDFIVDVIGTNGTWVYSSDGPSYLPAMDKESPVVIGAASRRVIPDGFFQKPSYTGTNFGYTEPSWNELASYGSFIFQSKLPGTGVHLSLDVKGTSNSERMMTYPTEVLWNPTKISPQQQAGRFIPFVTYGVSMAEINSTSLNDGSKFYVVGANDKKYNETQTNAHPINVLTRKGIYSKNGVQNPVVIPNEHILDGYTVVVDYIDNYDLNCQGALKLYDPNDTYTPMGLEEMILYCNFEPNGDTDNLQYCLSVQGYISVRLKHLRTHALSLINTYPRIGFYSGNWFTCPYTWLIQENTSAIPGSQAALFPYVQGTLRMNILIFKNSTSVTNNLSTTLTNLLNGVNTNGFGRILGVCYIVPSSVPTIGSRCTKVYSASGNVTLTSTEFTTACGTDYTSLKDWYDAVNNVWDTKGDNNYLVLYTFNSGIGVRDTNVEWFGMLSQDSTCDGNDQILFHHIVDTDHVVDTYGWIQDTGFLNNSFVSSSYSV